MNPDTHFYLYAKNHYERSDLKTDLRKIMAKRCMIPVDLADMYDVIDCLLVLTFKHISESGNPGHFFCDFVRRTEPYSLWRNFSVKEEDDHVVRVAKACLSVLAWVTVKDLDLGDPDSAILPLCK